MNCKYIDREELVAELNRRDVLYNAVINEVIYSLPVAKDGWIPVTERLPEEDGRYLVTNTQGNVVEYVFNKDGNSVEYWGRCATAWMPLPEPYKEK